MKTAVFDNPATFCREAWKDGVLVAHLSAHVIMMKGFNGHPRLFFPLNCGEWEHGKVRGDADAIAGYEVPEVK